MFKFKRKKDKVEATTVKTPKIAVFVDAANLWGSYKSLGRLLDLSKLHDFFGKKFNAEVFKMLYYEAYREEEEGSEAMQKQYKFFKNLQDNMKITPVTKALKIIKQRTDRGKPLIDELTGAIEVMEKGNFDVEITIDAVSLADQYEIAVFMTGDSDFLPLMHYLQRLGKNVYVFSTRNTVSNELLEEADQYFDWKDFSELHGRYLKSK